jgi:putative hydrolase of the HAD superfamily
MKYDAVVFDLFGTLVDYLPEQDHDDASSKLAAVLGVPVDVYRRVWSLTMPDRDVGRFGSVEADIENAVRILGIHPDRALIEEAAQIRLNLYKRGLEPRASAVETLTSLRSTGHKIGLITVCGAEVITLWDDTQFSPLIDVAIFSCLDGLSKPDPKIYRLACERLDVMPERCLYIGDGSNQELSGAQSIGMHPVLIKRGFKDGKDTSQSAIEEWNGLAISSLPEILDIVETTFDLEVEKW